MPSSRNTCWGSNAFLPAPAAEPAHVIAQLGRRQEQLLPLGAVHGRPRPRDGDVLLQQREVVRADDHGRHGQGERVAQRRLGRPVEVPVRERLHGEEAGAALTGQGHEVTLDAREVEPVEVVEARHQHVERVLAQGVHQPVGPAVAGDADEPHLPRLPGGHGRLQGAAGGEHPVDLGRRLDPVDEGDVHAVGAEVGEAAVQLRGEAGRVALRRLGGQHERVAPVRDRPGRCGSPRSPSPYPAAVSR